MTSEKNGTALARVEPGEASAMAAPGDFGPEHMRIVREAFAPTATQAEFEVMWAGAKARRLDPVRKQIHFVKRRTKRDNAWVDQWTSIVAIDGFRAIAEGTGKYDGQDEPEYEYDVKGRLLIARVRIYRKDIGRPFVGVARWTEYVQTDGDGNPTSTWKKMEHTMLAKCAEALGLRKAFPEPLAGLYTGDEMMQADNEGNVSVSRPVEPRPVVQASDSGRATIVSPHPVSPDVERERARWKSDGGDENTERALAGSPDPNDRALVYAWRIDNAESLDALAKIATAIGADPHEVMRTEMLGRAEKRRGEMAAGVAA